jgi:hypothetical protein
VPLTSVGAAFGSVDCVASAPVGAAGYVDAGGVVAVVGAAGSVYAGVVGAVVVGVAGVVVGAAAVVEGSAIGVPIWSLTTGADANGSVGCCVELGLLGATCVCVSLTTGTLRRTGVATAGACDRCAAVDVCACDFGSGGIGATACSFGTRSSGTAKFGTARLCSGVVGAGIAACLKTAAIGAAYSATSTTRPRPAQ